MCSCLKKKNYNTKLHLASVYAQNTFDTSCFVLLEKSLSKFPDTSLIVGGFYSSYL